MASIDHRVAAIVDNRDTSDSDDEDALLASLEEDDDHALSALREQRMQQLHDEVQRSKRMRESGTGHYAEIKDEKDVMDITTGTKLCVVHFFKPDFGRCGVMDGHLEVSSDHRISLIAVLLLRICTNDTAGPGTQTLRHPVHQDQCGERTLLSHQAQSSSSSMRDRLRRWSRSGPDHRI